MSDVIVLRSPDGHEFDVSEALPLGAAKGTIVVIQEIFGVNAHIREVAQGFAEQGYRALAPALFDRVERQVALGYSGADMMQGVELARGKLRREDALMDLQTTIDAAAGTGPVGVVGYCFGGLLAWLADRRPGAGKHQCTRMDYAGFHAGAVGRFPDRHHRRLGV